MFFKLLWGGGGNATEEHVDLLKLFLDYRDINILNIKKLVVIFEDIRIVILFNNMCSRQKYIPTPCYKR